MLDQLADVCSTSIVPSWIMRRLLRRDPHAVVAQLRQPVAARAGDADGDQADGRGPPARPRARSRSRRWSRGRWRRRRAGRTPASGARTPPRSRSRCRSRVNAGALSASATAGSGAPVEQEAAGELGGDVLGVGGAAAVSEQDQLAAAAVARRDRRGDPLAAARPASPSASALRPSRACSSSRRPTRPASAIVHAPGRQPVVLERELGHRAPIRVSASATRCFLWNSQ